MAVCHVTLNKIPIIKYKPLVCFVCVVDGKLLLVFRSIVFSLPANKNLTFIKTD
jgi:hypothetical protein